MCLIDLPLFGLVDLRFTVADAKSFPPSERNSAISGAGGRLKGGLSVADHGIMVQAVQLRAPAG